MSTTHPFVSGAGADAALAAVLRENGQLAGLYLAAEQRIGDLANLFVAVNSIHGATDTAGVVVAVREIVANLVGSEEMAIFEAERGTGRLTLVAALGIDPAAVQDLRLGQGAVGEVAATGQPLIRREGGTGEPGTDGALTACLPLLVGSSVVGALAIYRLLPHKHALEQVDLDLFDLLSAHVGAALLFSRLYAGDAA
jgi:GAF domain-containing protein